MNTCGTSNQGEDGREDLTQGDSRAPTRLRAEHLDHALGIGDRTPRLSWQLSDGTARQLAYRLRIDSGGDTEWVESDRSVLVPWPFEPLRSLQRLTWRVQVRTDRGESRWSEPASIEAGLLDAADWTAIWVRPAEEVIPPPGQRPAYELRGMVTVEKRVQTARLYATAHGIYEVFINGRRVGDVELAPGFTQYTSRLQVQTYDVTELLAEAANEVRAILSDGWFRGEVGVMRASDQWGARTAFLAQLEVEDAGGGRMVAGTDPTWTSRHSHVLRADLIEGQSEDRRRLFHPHDAWQPVIPAELGFDRLVCPAAPPVRRVQELRPVAVERLSSGRQIVDLGQNINGWVRLRRLGPEGTALTLTHGEALGPDGDVTMRHLQPDFPFIPHPLSAGQVDQVVSAGHEGDTFEPRHTTHGFRYVRVEGHPEELTPEDVAGLVVHTDMRRTGWFSCSDARVNRLHEAVVWSFRGNACDIPTDCPTRERAGWTGDWQIFVPAAAFIYDVAGFSTKWLRDVAADQWENGVIANISPSARAEGRESPMAHANGSAGWGDAVVIVPWEIYRAYGDARLLKELWPTMVAWLGYVERTAAEGRHPDRVARSIDPVPHERYLWDSGFHFGEWLVPGETISDFEAFGRQDKADVATAYFAYSAGLMARIAAVLNRPAEAARYAELAEQVKAAWKADFVEAGGRVRPNTQANLVRALAFNLVPDELRVQVAAQLVELIRTAGTHLRTGFLATPYLLPVLADHGYPDVAYALLLQDTPPSWLTMIDRGTTTVWEDWEGIDEEGWPHLSLNHYSKGAVISFLHRYAAGIRPGDEPAYRSFRIEPVPGGGLTSASAAHESPYGRIESSWFIRDGAFHLDVLVPPGTTAELVMPGMQGEQVGPGRHSRSRAWPGDGH